MAQRSKRDQFYTDVADAMAMNGMRGYINLETLEVEMYPPEDSFDYKDESDPDEETLDDPDKYMFIEPVRSTRSFKVMEAFADVVQDKRLHEKLMQALEGRKPFANFKYVIDESAEREEWFAFKNNQYLEMAKEWLEDHAGDKLKEKIQSLPAVFIPEG